MARKRRPDLERLIEEATVDAPDEGEQLMGFFTMLEDNLVVPFETVVLGVPVTVERIEMAEDDSIVAVCKRGKVRQAIPILSLPLPKSPPRGSEWIDAFKLWKSGG